MGRRIRDLRQQLGLSQEEVASPNYTAAYLSQVENGKRQPSHEALTHFSERLGVTVEQLASGRDPDLDLRLEVQAQRALAQVHSGELDPAVEALSEVRSAAQASGHRRAEQQAELGLGLAFRLQGHTDEALAAYERAEALAPGEPPESRTSALAGQARCLFQMGDVRDAIHILESHLIELQRRDPPEPSRLVETYSALIPAYFESGMIEKAKETATKGWALAPNIPEVEHRACLYVNRAQLMLTQGERREALASMALAEDLYRHLGWHTETVKVTLGRALALIDAEDLGAAESLLQDVLSGADTSLSRFDRVKGLTQLARVRRLQGAPHEGFEFARQALTVAGQKVPVAAAEAAREAGMCALGLQDSVAALDYCRRALKAFVRFGDHEEAAKTSRLLGDLLTESGDPHGAAAAYRAGLDAVEELR
ncbi:MAG: helix-turn-helix domain-containing protein [Actinomycetota bacterium]|nr:helix-turn-helix domain-containing protein [Actinomycetota bacterium]